MTDNPFPGVEAMPIYIGRDPRDRDYAYVIHRSMTWVVLGCPGMDMSGLSTVFATGGFVVLRGAITRTVTADDDGKFRFPKVEGYEFYACQKVSDDMGVAFYRPL